MSLLFNSPGSYNTKHSKNKSIISHNQTPQWIQQESVVFFVFLNIFHYLSLGVSSGSSTALCEAVKASTLTRARVLTQPRKEERKRDLLPGKCVLFQLVSRVGSKGARVSWQWCYNAAAAPSAHHSTRNSSSSCSQSHTSQQHTEEFWDISCTTRLLFWANKSNSKWQQQQTFVYKKIQLLWQIFIIVFVHF